MDTKFRALSSKEIHDTLSNNIRRVIDADVDLPELANVDLPGLVYSNVALPELANVDLPGLVYSNGALPELANVDLPGLVYSNGALPELADVDLPELANVDLPELAPVSDILELDLPIILDKSELPSDSDSDTKKVNTSNLILAPLVVVPKAPPVKLSNINFISDKHGLPLEITEKLSFYSLDSKIKDFKETTLFEVIRGNSSTIFPSTGTKVCYRLEYSTLTLTILKALDNFSDAIVDPYATSYIKQHMNSISGEQNDICYYTYSPEELHKFLDDNSNKRYAFLPMTVYSVDSANGIRHDMLLIFDNTSYLFYWFDCKNREDYLPINKNLPKNVIDILLVTMSEKLNLGYSYEPSPSWQITGTLHSYGSVGDFDFLMSTAWCFNVIQMLDYYSSPTAYMSVLDCMSESDRFHLGYTSMLNMIHGKYHQYIPAVSQVNLTSPTIANVKHIDSTVTPFSTNAGELPDTTHDGIRHMHSTSRPANQSNNHKDKCSIM